MIKVIEGSNMEELIKNLPDIFKDIVSKASQEDNNVETDKKISDEVIVDDKTTYKTDIKWGIIEKQFEDKIATTVIVVAPFADEKTVTAKFQKNSNDKYNIRLSWQNVKMPFSSGNINIRDVDVIHLGDFKKIEKKSVKIQYKDGTYQISFNQFKNDDHTEFSMGITK